MRSTLDKMEVNQKSDVIKISKESPLTRRFLDIGLTKGTKVECILKSYGDEMKAYRIKGATIGIRKEDAENVEIEM